MTDKAPEGAPIKLSAEQAYWAEIARIRESAFKIAQESRLRSTFSDALDIVCMMLVAAFEDRAKITEFISSGYIRDGRYVHRPIKPPREAL